MRYVGFISVWLAHAAVTCMAMHTTGKWWFCLFIIPAWIACAILPPKPPKPRPPFRGPWKVERPFRTNTKGETWWIAQVGDKVKVNHDRYGLSSNVYYTVSRVFTSSAGYDCAIFAEDFEKAAKGTGWWLDIKEFDVVTFNRPVTEDELETAASIKSESHESLEEFAKLQTKK